MSPSGVISCTCPVGYTGSLCDIRKSSIFFKSNFIYLFNLAIDICAQNNRSCLNNGVCVISPNTSAYCNCSSPAYTGTRCEV